MHQEDGLSAPGLIGKQLSHCKERTSAPKRLALRSSFSKRSSSAVPSGISQLASFLTSCISTQANCNVRLPGLLLMRVELTTHEFAQ